MKIVRIKMFASQCLLAKNNSLTPTTLNSDLFSHFQRLRLLTNLYDGSCTIVLSERCNSGITFFNLMYQYAGALSALMNIYSVFPINVESDYLTLLGDLQPVWSIM